MALPLVAIDFLVHFTGDPRHQFGQAAREGSYKDPRIWQPSASLPLRRSMIHARFGKFVGAECVSQTGPVMVTSAFRLHMWLVFGHSGKSCMCLNVTVIATARVGRASVGLGVTSVLGGVPACVRIGGSAWNIRQCPGDALLRRSVVGAIGPGRCCRGRQERAGWLQEGDIYPVPAPLVHGTADRPQSVSRA